MSYNYCLVIASSKIKSKLLAKLKKESVSFNLITTEEGDEVSQDDKILLSYEGRSFPDLNKSFPDNVLTLSVDGGEARYQTNGNWELARAYGAGISLQMGYSLLQADLKKIKKDKEIASILKAIKGTETMLTSESDDEIEQISHELIIDSEQDSSVNHTLCTLLKNLAEALEGRGYQHFVAWFEGTQSQISGDLPESFLYPLVYADAFWDEDDGSSHRLHITNSEIFHE